MCLVERYCNILEDDLAAKDEQDARRREALRYLASERELIRKWCQLIDEVETFIVSPDSARKTMDAWDAEADVFFTYATEFWVPRYDGTSGRDCAN